MEAHRLAVRGLSVRGVGLKFFAIQLTGSPLTWQQPPHLLCFICFYLTGKASCVLNAVSLDGFTV